MKKRMSQMLAWLLALAMLWTGVPVQSMSYVFAEESVEATAEAEEAEPEEEDEPEEKVEEKKEEPKTEVKSDTKDDDKSDEKIEEDDEKSDEESDVTEKEDEKKSEEEAEDEDLTKDELAEGKAQVSFTGTTHIEKIVWSTSEDGEYTEVDGSIEVDEESNVYFKMTVEEGYEVTNVSGASETEEESGIYKISSVTGEVEVEITTAEVAATTRKVTFTMDENVAKVTYFVGEEDLEGTELTESGDADVDKEKAVTFAVECKEDYEVEAVVIVKEEAEDEELTLDEEELVYTLVAGEDAVEIAITTQEAVVEEEDQLLAYYSFSHDQESLANNAVVKNEADNEFGDAYDAHFKGTGAYYMAGSGVVLPGGGNGSSKSYVEIPGEVFEGRDNLTISIWLRNWTGAGNYAAMFFGTKAQSNGLPLHYWLLNPCEVDRVNRLKTVMTNGTNSDEPYKTETKANVSSVTTNDNSWHMYTTVISDTDVIGYFDGKEVVKNSHTMQLSEFGTGLKAYIGKSEYPDKQYWGGIRDCEIYNYAMTGDQVGDLFKKYQEEPNTKLAKVATGLNKDFLPEGGVKKVASGEDYELPSKAEIIMKDGENEMGHVTWRDAEGRIVKNATDFDEGTYTLTGKVENYFDNPFIEQKADPMVFKDNTPGAPHKYVFTSSWPAYNDVNHGYDRVSIRVSDTLEGLAEAEEHTIWDAADHGGVKHVWAPEIHRINGDWYVYYTHSDNASSIWALGNYVLKCPGDKDITDKNNWEDLGRFQDKDGGTEIFSGFSLDMTYFEDKDEQGYVCWARKQTVSSLMLGKVDKTNPIQLTSEAVMITEPDYTWENVKERVNEGPAVLRRNGKIYLAYSASATGPEYCVGLLTADDGADLLDLKSWDKAKNPIMYSGVLNEEYGPGHNSFTTDDEGRDVIVYHARSKECYENKCAWHSASDLYDPCRHARLAYVRFDDEGAPYFTSTAYRELEAIRDETVTLTLQVEDTSENEKLMDMPLLEDAKDVTDNGYTGNIVGEESTFDRGFVISGGTNKRKLNYIDLSENEDLLAALKEQDSVTFTAWVRNDTSETNSNSRTTVFSLGKDEKNYFAFNTLNWAKARIKFVVEDEEEEKKEKEYGIQYDTTGNVNSILQAWYPVSVELKKVGEKTRIKYYMNDILACDVTANIDMSTIFDELAFFYIGGAPEDATNYFDMNGGIRDFRIYTGNMSALRLRNADHERAIRELKAKLGATGEENEITTSDDLTLPASSYPDLQFAWESSNPAVLTNDGQLMKASKDPVTLTAHMTSNKDETYQEDLTFKVTVALEDYNEHLFAYYPLLEDASDAKSNRKGSVVGNVTFDRGMIVTDSQTVNKTNYVDISNKELLEKIQDAKNLTITAWVRNDSGDTNNNNRPTVFAFGSDEENYFSMSTGNWGCARAHFTLDGFGVTNSKNPNVAIVYNTDGNKKSILGEWYPIAIELIDKSTSTAPITQLKYYANDELLCDVETPCAISELGDLSYFYVGTGNGAWHDMDGGIRNVKIYDTTLTGKAVLQQDMEMIRNNLIVEMGAKGTDNIVTTPAEGMDLPMSAQPEITYSWALDRDDVFDAETGKLISLSEEKRTVKATASIVCGLDARYNTSVDFEIDVTPASYSRWMDEALAKLKLQDLDDVRGNIYMPLEYVTEDGAGTINIEWESSDPEVISDTEEDGKLPGVVTRGSSNQEVTLTATLSIDGYSITKEKVFTANVRKAIGKQTYTKYMFAYFIGDGAGQENIFFADSEDGLNWTALNKAQPIFKSTMGEKGLRDPFIIRSPEGDKFYMIATDLQIAAGRGWGAAQTAGSQSIMIWESTDLVNWSDQRMIKVARDDAGCTWAPEAFWDDEVGAYMVFWASKVAEDSYGPHRVYRAYTRDFYNFTEPEVWIELHNTSGKTISVIDTTVISVGEGKDKVYYRFSKDEESSDAAIDPGDPTTGKFIFLEKSNSLSGTWTRIKSPTLNAETGREGATSFKFNGEDKWCLLLDNFGGGGYYPMVTTDISSGEFTKLGKSEYSMPPAALMRHGTVLNITDHEYAELEHKWGTPKQKSTVEPARIAYFSFDNGSTGFAASGAKAEKIGEDMNLSKDVREGATGKALNIFEDGSYLNVKKADGSSLLTGLDEMTISFWSKPDKPYSGDNGSWVMFAAPSAAAPSYPNEKYISITDANTQTEVSRWNNSGARQPAIAVSRPDREWHHFVVSFNTADTRLYRDGELISTLASTCDIANMLGKSSIFQIGKAQWKTGEYYHGMIDDFEVFNFPVSADQAQLLFEGKSDEVVEEAIEESREPVKASYISVAKEDGTSTFVNGESYQMVATVLPEDTDDKSVAWSSSDETVVTVDENGVATCVNYGSATIIATAQDGSDVYGVMDITVTPKTYTLKLDANGGKWGSMTTKTVKVYEDELVEMPERPEFRDYDLLYWSKTQDGKDRWYFDSDTVSGDFTLYAIWVKKQDLDKRVEVGVVPQQYYTGGKIMPEVFAYDGDIKLVEGIDYTLSYKNNTVANIDRNGNPLVAAGKEPYVEVKGKGNYKNQNNQQIKAGFDIVACPIENIDVTFTDTYIAVPANKKITPKVALTFNGKKLGNKDYTLMWYNESDSTFTRPLEKIYAAGTYKGVIRGYGNFDGSRVIKIVVKPDNMKLLADAKVTLDYATANYTGDALKPGVKLLKIGSAVIDPSEFVVSYRNNTYPGKASVIIKPKAGSDLLAGSKEVNFTIKGTPISKAKADGIIAKVDFTGDEIVMPDLKLTFNGEELTYDEEDPSENEYSVEYKNNVHAGKASIVITGLKGYEGTVTKTFTINKIDLSKAKVSVERTVGDDVEMNKAGALIDDVYVEVTPVDMNGYELDPITLYQGYDFTLEYKNNKTISHDAEGTLVVKETALPTATVKAIGSDFSGKVAASNVITFHIVPKSLDSEDITIVAENVAFNDKKTSFTTKVTVYDSGMKIAEKADYVINYSDNTGITDAARVTLTGGAKGCYKGEAYATFRIYEKEIKTATIVVEKSDDLGGLYYYNDGKVIQPKLTVYAGKPGQSDVLTPGVHYTVDYGTDGKVGAHTITVKGEGTYGGSKTAKFVVAPKWLQFN